MKGNKGPWLNLQLHGKYLKPLGHQDTRELFLLEH